VSLANFERRRKVKKVLLAAAAIIGLSAGVAQADFAAIAAGDGGYGWVSGGYGSMEAARAAAKQECRRRGYGSCESSVAEHSSWYYSGGQCNGRTYVGGSPHSQYRADRMVIKKAAADGYGNCVIEVQF